MRRSTLVLLAGCLGLAAALAYVVRDLHDERARASEQTAELTELRARLVAADQPRSAPQLSAAATQPAEPAPPSPPSGAPVAEPDAKMGPKIDDLAKSEDEARALRDMRANQAVLAQSLADPIARAKLKVDAMAEIRRTSPDLARALGLTSQQETRLLELMADQQLQMKALGAQGGGQQPVDHRQLYQRHEGELRALLGPERIERFRQYRASAPERAQVQALNARLDEKTALREDQAARLVELMHEEREAYVARLTQDGAGGFLTEYPFTPFSSGDDPVEEVRFAEAQLPRTEEFLQRIQGRAASVLTREQLRRYAEIQAEQMASERRRLEWLREKASRSN
jgi:hypothetical protein